jgi:hypothetical protein
MHLYPQEDGFVVTWFDRGFDHKWKIYVNEKKLCLENIVHESFDESKELCLYPIEVSNKNVKIKYYTNGEVSIGNFHFALLCDVIYCTLSGRKWHEIHLWKYRTKLQVEKLSQDLEKMDM